MSILGVEGFDNYGQPTDLLRRSGNLVWIGAPVLLRGTQSYPVFNIQSPGRGGFGKCIGLNSVLSTAGDNTQLILGLSKPVQKATVGFAICPPAPGLAAEATSRYNIYNLCIDFFDVSFYQNSYGTNNIYHLRWVFNFIQGTITLFDLTVNPQTGLQVATQIGVALNVLQPGVWSYVELQGSISQTAGTAAIRVNGRALPSFPDLTGIASQSTAHPYMTGVAFTTTNGSSEYATVGFPVYTLLDDLYVTDNSSASSVLPNNGFLGDIRCATQFPIANGTTIEWTPLTETNWQEVSEPSFDGDTSFNYSSTVGAIDVFPGNPLPEANALVLGLTVTVGVRMTDAGNRTLAPVVMIDGTVYQGTPQVVDVSYLFLSYVWELNPATNNPWTAQDVNGVQFGYTIVS